MRKKTSIARSSLATSLAAGAVLVCGACEEGAYYDGTIIVYVLPDGSVRPPAQDAAGEEERGIDGAAGAGDAPEEAEAAPEGTTGDTADDLATDTLVDAAADVSGADATATCHDNVRDGDETDIDCGGSCPPCSLAQGCLVDADCSKAAAGCDAALGGCTCDAISRTCAADHCVDHKKDDGESDVDCGGGQCPGCGPNKVCVATSDCSVSASGCDAAHGGCFCDLVTGTCVYSHCFDQGKDFSETDLDCGGGDCVQCSAGQGCFIDFDCTTNACDGISAVCISNPCSDHRQDGVETDVDCGGPDTCPRCLTGKKCVANGDCQLGHTCSAAPHVCL
jgi:hypothetical protein